MTELFIPPAPVPPPAPKSDRTTLLGYARYFQTMRRNPLEIWSDAAYRSDIIESRFLGRNWLFIHDPEAIRSVYVTNASRYSLPGLRKSFLRPVLGEGLFLAEGAYWRSTRKALTPMFTPRHVARFEAVMQSIAEERAQQWRKDNEPERDISQEMLRLTLDILMACLFSNEDSIDLGAFSETLETLLKENGLPHAFDLIGAPRFIPRPGRNRAEELAGRLRAQMRVMIRARRRRMRDGQNEQRDFLTLLMDARDEQSKPLSDSAIVDNLLTFFAAGHETTARSLGWALYLLAKAPHIQDAVRNELQEKAESPLLDAAIRETLRLYPAAAQINRLANEADTIAGHDIAPGTEVFTSLWVLHRHEALWTNPLAYDPERFLGQRAEAIHRFQYLPFGLGPRICIGAHFATVEMRHVLSALLRAFRFTPSGDHEPEPVMRVTVQPRVAIRLRTESV